MELLRQTSYDLDKWMFRSARKQADAFGPTVALWHRSWNSGISVLFPNRSSQDKFQFHKGTMRLLSISVVTLLLSALEAGCAAFSQLCKADQIHDVDICMVFATPEHDPSTYHLAFSGRFPQGRGWAAFGHGSAMDEALMFVFYPNERENGLTVSVRSTSGHYPPHVSSQHGNLSVLQTFVDSEGYYHAEIKCESCRALENEHDGYESWIWSANDYQIFRTSEVDEQLQMHVLYDRFEMTVEMLSGSTLALAGSRISTGIKGPGSKDAAPFDLLKAHAFLMLLAFLAVYPAGVLAILHGGKRAFWMHAGAQLSGTSCVLLAGAFAILASHGHSHSHGPLILSHQVLGFAILILILCQGGIGYLHHRIFVLTQEKSCWSRWHRILGYVVLLSGFSNAALGLYIRQGFDNFGFPLLLGGLACGTWAMVGKIIEKFSQPDDVLIRM